MQDFYLWCDFIERDFLETRFVDLLALKRISGATSNPSLFAQAIIHSQAYKEAMSAHKPNTPKALYEALALEDIARAADLLLPLYHQNQATGYISLEIDPFLEGDVSACVQEAERLYQTLARPNVMIKIPATPSGLEAMAHLSAHMPINATLIFSPQQAQECALALKEARHTCVISIFVSRLDVALEAFLAQAPSSTAQRAQLAHQLGVSSAQQSYHKIQSLNLPHLYPLFASTGVKEPTLPKDYYIQALKMPHSINTAPLEALYTYYHTPSPTPHILEYPVLVSQLEGLGFDVDQHYQALLKAGLTSFQEAFKGLLKTLE
ncbi:transaldolase [Helicobacter baculiformis]|uniref:Transaldolase n=1 Tax=Helicobacter baculiformis TaxID=427351 RepID=A0ABV7ZH61_9HELI|nr:transaldolase [Helicobacter baculiformis]